MMLDREKHDSITSDQIKRHVFFQDHLPKIVSFPQAGA
jgi:hypothetical protein